MFEYLFNHNLCLAVESSYFIFSCVTLYIYWVFCYFFFRCTTCCWSVYVQCTQSRQGRFQKTSMRPSLSGSRCTQHASYGWPLWHCTSGQETHTRLVFKKYTNLFIITVSCNDSNIVWTWCAPLNLEGWRLSPFANRR